MSQPLVSVIINAYNGAAYLRDAIQSVYAQTLSDFEIVLFDDASTDATPDAARGFDERLRYFRSERQLPLGEARNRALELARGKYISFLDQDDLFLPEKLARQVAAFTGDVGLVFSNSIRFWEGTNRTELLYRSRPPNGRAFRPLLRAYYLSINTVTILREALPADPRWWFPPAFRMCEETDLFLRLAYARPIAYVDAPLAKYRVHGQNFSIQKREYLISEQEEILRRLTTLIPDFGRAYNEEISVFRAEIKRTQAHLFWRNGRRAQAWSAYREALALNPRPVLFAELLLSLGLPFEALVSARRLIGRPV